MRRLIAPLVAAGLVLAPTAAAAQWAATAGGAATVTSSTVTDLSGFVAACASDTAIRLTWNATPDAFMQGYEILRTGTGGGTARTIHLGGHTNASFLDDQLAPANGNDAHTYSYTIRAGSMQHSWTTTTLAASRTITVRAHNKGGCTNN